MELTEQIPNDPPRMGAKSTTTSNHPSTPVKLEKKINIIDDPEKDRSHVFQEFYQDTEFSVIHVFEVSLRHAHLFLICKCMVVYYVSPLVLS